MNIAATKLELIDQLMSIEDEKVLRKVASFFKQVEMENSDFTAEELAELDKRRASRLSGESKGISAEDSIQQLRASQTKDEAA